MARMYFEDHSDLRHVAGQTVCIVGYGNQGRSQALNMRDSGMNVVVGSRRDESFDAARQDGFEVQPVGAAVARSDVTFLLVPDEVMPQVFDRDIAPNLEAGNMVVFASGYNIAFDLIEPPADVDVVMIAPRMIGAGVRDTYLSGEGFPSLIAVHQAATGTALERMLALCEGIGSTRMGVIESSFLEEATVDLFAEQVGFLYAVRRYCEVLVEAGCSPEVAMLEFYASGEGIETAKAYRDIGLWDQITLHSRTSQYGQEVTARLSPEEEEAERSRLRAIISRIQDGSFAREWAAEQGAGFPEFDRVRELNMAHELRAAERRLYEVLGRIPSG
ncbi:ketol-acid reductoisomerase [Candidatus Spongiisocius sp.]|uniref:ketol-acid reductoisomerase n=1 Tax=Candidatus Spongiisocius sp. TaxID=3101273 RepID=UPI003B5B91A3